MKIQRLIAASLLLLAMMSLSSVAFAKGPYPPHVKGKIIRRHPTRDVVGPNALQRGPSSPSTSGSPFLPFTGADVVGILLVGFVAIGTGTVLVRRFRVRAEI